MRQFILCFCMIGMFSAKLYAAEPVKVFVSEFNVVGSAVGANNELKQVLQSLVRSQVSDQNVLAVDTAGEADVLVKGTYVSYGGFNNIDVSVVMGDGHSVARISKGFSDEKKLMDAVINVSDGLRTAILGHWETRPRKQLSSLDQNKILVEKKSSDNKFIVHKNDTVSSSTDVKIKLDGKYNQIRYVTFSGKPAFAASTDKGIKLIDMSGNRLASREWPAGIKVIYLDSFVSQNNEYLIVTRLDLNDVYTDVYSLGGKGLEAVAVNQPYFVSVRKGKEQDRIYIQEPGSAPDRFFGNVYEGALRGNKLNKTLKLDLPKYANVYNFANVLLKSGERLIVLFDEDRYLTVYNEQYKKVWKSMERFGGSELFYQVKGGVNYKSTGKEFTTYFMEQRIQQLDDNTLLIVKNDGSLVVGDVRVYKKGALYALRWTGAELEELWHTKESQSYLADYYLDKGSVLYQLLLTQREDPIGNDHAISLIQAHLISQ